MDGGPWNPWIPSKVNSHIPAENAKDDSGIVAIPHLSRDLIACFDGNGSNFGTHPQNVLRGMIYYDDNGSIEYPYLYNLIDQYRHLAKYNNGYSYNMMFVGPGWLNRAGRWECPYELLAKSYQDGMKYYGNLKKEGKLLDMTMSEFADFYRETHPDYTVGECALWKDILYGSNKQYFWYADPFMRTCLDFNQGGAMIDLRPYAAKIDWKTGIGTQHVYDASYPYLIQANYRAGYFTHYAGAGTVKSCKITYHGQSADLCLCRTLASFSRTEKGIKVVANPVTVTLDGLNIEIQSVFSIDSGSGKMVVERNILNDLYGEKITIEEYFTGAFGTNEYQADMSKIRLSVGEQKMNYEYLGRKLTSTNPTDVATVIIPDITTKIELGGNGDLSTVEEGIAFSPVYHLSVSKTLCEGGLTTWLSLQKEN